MKIPNLVDPAIASSASTIPLEDYIAQILSDYGVTHSHLNRDQNRRIDRNAKESREQLRLVVLRRYPQSTAEQPEPHREDAHNEGESLLEKIRVLALDVLKPQLGNRSWLRS